MKTIRSISAMILFLAPAEARGQTPNPPNSLGQGLAILGSFGERPSGWLTLGFLGLALS